MILDIFIFETGKFLQKYYNLLEKMWIIYDFGLKLPEYHDFVEYGLTFEPYIQFKKIKKLNNLEFHQDHESQSASLLYCSQSASSCRDHGTIEISCLVRVVKKNFICIKRGEQTLS